MCAGAGETQRAPAASLWRMACCLLSALSAVTACTSGGQLSNLGAAGEGETKWLKAKSTSLIVGTGLHPAAHTCIHRTRRSLPSETGAHPAAAATSDSTCDCICSCCCNLVESVLICPQLFSLPPAVPFFKSPLNALRRGERAFIAAASPKRPPLQTVTDGV